MFQKGNTYSKGRPRISLTRPELLLPMIFTKASVNWANDFVKLYRMMKERPLSPHEVSQQKFLMDLMPYLCTKVQLKEIDGAKLTSPADSVAAAKQTSKLLEALEKENGSQPSSPSSGS